MAEPFDRYQVTVDPADSARFGGDHLALQAAVELVASRGGGTVKLAPGRWELRAAVRLRDGVRLLGSGDDTVLVKAPEIHGALADDVDWYERCVKLRDASGFRVGDGIILQGEVPFGGSPGLHKVKRTILAIEGDTLWLDETVGRNFWLDYEPRLSSLFPLIWGEPVRDAAIVSLRLDGHRAANGFLDGNHDGCIFLQHARRVTIDDVTAHDNHGDGISWQVADDVRVTRCRVHDCAGLGLHPGSGSQRPIMTGCHLHHNRLGLFFCWGVKHGVAEGNRIEDNTTHGVSIGHRDTDNLVRDNLIQRNGETGILLRADAHDRAVPARLPHRNRLEANDIADCGGAANGYGIWIQGPVAGTEIVGCALRRGDGGRQRVGVRIEPDVLDVTIDGCRFEGLEPEIDDARGAATA